MPQTNLIKTPDLGAVDAIDFVEKFAYSIEKLRLALGITRPQPMKQGNTIKTFKYTITDPTAAEGDTGDPANGEVAEGEDIPLTAVKREVDQEYTVKFKKYRKAVTIEEVQRVGYELAANKTDKEVLKKIQKQVRTDFFNYLDDSAQDMGEVANLQAAFGKAWGKLGSVFDDEEIDTIVFINPEDAGDYLGNAVIENGQSVGFGMTLLKGFTNVNVIIMNSVPKGTWYATVQDNLNLQFIDVKGEASKIFHGKQLTTDETGLIALVKDDNTTNLSDQSTIFLGLALFAELSDGVLKGTIAAPKSVTPDDGGADAGTMAGKADGDAGKDAADLTGKSQEYSDAYTVAYITAKAEKDKAEGTAAGKADGDVGKNATDNSSKSQTYQDAYTAAYTPAKAAYDEANETTSGFDPSGETKPTDANTVADITAWLDAHSIDHTGKTLKADLLALVPTA